jgi:DNA-binding CsgD family transcriptional regulator/PAS domain-containing protein
VRKQAFPGHLIPPDQMKEEPYPPGAYMRRSATVTPDNVVDRIYTAALDQDAWAPAIEGMEQMFDGHACGIYVSELHRQEARLIHIRGMDPDYLAYYIAHYLFDNPWTKYVRLQRPGAIRTEHTLDEFHNDPGYYRRTAFFNEWMKPQEFIHTLGTNLHADPRILIKCYVYRAPARGEFERTEIDQFSRLTGHLMNAVRVARRLAVEGAAADELSDMVDRLNFGVVLLDDHARVLQANRFARELFRRREGLMMQKGQLMAARPSDRAAFSRLVKDAVFVHLDESLDVPQRVNLYRPAPRRPVCASAVPLPRHHDNPFAERQSAVALIITDPDMEPVISGTVLQSRFGLTAAEARLATSLAQGVSLRVAAEQTSLTYETARSYLKGIFHKTGTTRQTELLRLLLLEGGAVPSTPPPE